MSGRPWTSALALISDSACAFVASAVPEAAGLCSSSARSNRINTQSLTASDYPAQTDRIRALQETRFKSGRKYA